MQTSSILTDVEQLMLLAILRLGDGAYAVSIRGEIEDRAEIRFSRGTIYITLDRLEKKGCLESSFAEPTPERGGKSKRCFNVTAGGLEALAKVRTSFRSMWEGIEPLVDEV